jgi:aspartate/methionine/tyrosine aminotransferase
MQSHKKPGLNALNRTLLGMDIYASKAISLRAKADPTIANLSFGEPVFGPPPYLLEDIGKEDLSLDAFVGAAKRYEDARGSLSLRQAIADWYLDRYDLRLDPECEIMVTHGAVEAISLAVLVTTEARDRVVVSDPSYMLYARTLQTLEREPKRIARPAGVNEYVKMLNRDSHLDGVKAMIVNSPENPTGYVASMKDWERIGAAAARSGSWIIHDEVYDVMTFDRPHCPARKIEALAAKSIVINSFSKKFGLPGLRIGWMIAPRQIIDLAAKAHDYLYLGVNIQYERIAQRLLSDPRKADWLKSVVAKLQYRCVTALAKLDANAGYGWTRQPMGAMFLFPDVSGLYQNIPAEYRTAGVTIGDATTRYLLDERNIAVVPGSVYGKEGDNHIRLVLCTSDEVFEQAMHACAQPVEPAIACATASSGLAR